MGSQGDLEDWLERCKETGWRSTDRLAYRGRGAKTAGTEKEIESMVSEAVTAESKTQFQDKASQSSETARRVAETEIKDADDTEVLHSQNGPNSNVCKPNKDSTQKPISEVKLSKPDELIIDMSENPQSTEQSKLSSISKIGYDLGHDQIIGTKCNELIDYANDGDGRDADTQDSLATNEKGISSADDSSVHLQCSIAANDEEISNANDRTSDVQNSTAANDKGISSSDNMTVDLRESIGPNDKRIKNLTSANLYENVPSHSGPQGNMAESFSELNIKDKDYVVTYENLPNSDCKYDAQQETCSSFKDRNLDKSHLPRNDLQDQPNAGPCIHDATESYGCCDLYNKLTKRIVKKPPCGNTHTKLPVTEGTTDSTYINVVKGIDNNYGTSHSTRNQGYKDSFHTPYSLDDEIEVEDDNGNGPVSRLIGDNRVPSMPIPYADTTDNVYDELYEPQSDTGSESSFEPPWAQSVGKKGDVFYVEPGTADWNSEPPPGGTDTNYTHHGGTAPSTPVHNGLNNSPHPHHQPGSEITPTKTKTGLRKKVKGIITPKSKQNNNVNGHLQQNGGGHLGNGVARNNYRNQVNHSPHTVTFNDVPTGLTKDVRLFVDPHRHNYGRRATLCETLFGIVPGYFGSKVSQNGTTRDRRIMVQGLLPGGEALRSGQVKIGDWLMCVNDLEVNFDNFDSLLSAITTSMEVKLTLQKLAVQAVNTPRPGVVRKSPVVNEALVRLVSGDRAQLPSPSLTDVPHSVMFLTLESREDGPPKDVLYQFPAEDSKLVEIRGLFLTLGNLLPDVTDNTPRSSSMLIENKLVHVTYAREGQQVLIIALPADRLKLVQVNQIVEDIVRLLRVLYGSLKSAFSSKENAGRLDHFFSLFIQRSLLKQEMIKEGLQTADQDEPLLDLLAAVRALHLPEETKVIVNNTLSDFEAADFADMSDEFYDMRRSYTIMGSALFYKGYLLASHLHREDLRDAALYLRYYCLLTLCHSEQMGQMVVWKEVFPWRRCHVQTDPLLPGYTEPEARWFLLVVGLKNIMLTVLFEAGGAASWAEGHPTPDPFYVDQAKGSLLQLEALDIPNQCELRLMSPSIPSLASVDWFFPNTKGIKDDPAVLTTPLVKVQNSPKTGVSPSRKLLQPESILKKRGGSTPSPQNDRLRPPGARPGALYDVESDADSHSTGNSDTSTPIMDRRGRKPSAGSDESGGSGGSSSLFKGQKKKRTLLSAYDVSSLKSSLREAAMEEGSFVKLTSGCENTLFHYVHLDSAEGVFICPTQQELAAVSTPTHSRLLANFHSACLAIRHVFQDTAKKQSVHAAGRSGSFGAGSALSMVREHGILFHCTPENWTDTKKQPPVVSYWVVGRQLPEPYKREMYVCFQDSAQQNVIELAFKLGFGILV